MLESVLFHALLISAQPQTQPFLSVDENAESAAAVASAVRFEPATGRASTTIRNGADSWGRARHELERIEGRSRFSLEFEPESGRLTWSAGAGEPAVEIIVPAPVALEGPNLLRLELANFDRSASLAVEKLELALHGDRRELRWLGHGTMTRDLVTLFAPDLARGFRLTGELVMRGVPIAPSRIFLNFGLGRGRRVEVVIDGEGVVESVPSRLVRTPRRKSAVAYFAPEESATLRATSGRFREWENGGVAFAEREVDLARGSSDGIWTARFEPAEELASADRDASFRASARPEGVANVFTNPATILVPAGQPATTIGKASPYPSEIEVTGPVAGALSNVELVLKDVTHPFPDDLEALVVSPSGTAVLFLSDACGPTDVAAVDWRFDDFLTALTDGGPCAPGSFGPSLYDGVADPFDAPAPSAPYETDFGAFTSENANGIWKLYLFDDGSNDVGSIAGGWELEFGTGIASVRIPDSGSSGLGNPYPRSQTISATDPLAFGTILDVNVFVNQLWHQFPGDVDFLMVGPNGESVMLMSDACGSVEIAGATWTFDDEAAGPLSEDSTGCANGLHVRPTDYGLAESLPGPAPAGPYASALSVFDGDSPAGTWNFYFRDDTTADVGFISNSPVLQFTTTGIFRNGFESGPFNCLWEWNPDLGCDD